MMESQEGNTVQSMIYLVKADSSSAGVPPSSSWMSGRLRSAACHEGWIAIPAWQKDGIDVFLLDVPSGFGRPVARLLGATKITLRFSDRTLICADDRGRILALDAVSGRIIRDLRV